MGNQKNKLQLEKFRVTEIKNSNQIFGGSTAGGENPECSLSKLTTTTKNKDKGNQII
ncbi:hypothetical protein EV195_107174 [Tenacibaculum skagerrakense]|uniref:Uncharacterized protein n=1 Tax=Tenacibaculum skagerrakense TaxID=186571 RepID=A0A4R2NRJ1_9FLAO|nr:hypothetical protein [Tenacibaculum skagerrakense]TCP24008.1 hypothetical protein EV195_107174 [Tenacibaculum skagerrakense]